MLPKADDSWTIFEAAHLLNRAGFGGSPADVKALHALGRYKAVDSLILPQEALDAFPLPAWSTPEAALAEYNERREAVKAADEKSKGLSADEGAEMRRQARKESQRIERDHIIEAQGWWFRRILTTQAPLREKMTLFWHDHFATSFQKIKKPAMLIKQNELFREMAFGNFKDLTKSVMRDPAMLFYLDGQDSKKGAPNENFARELLELFTLGEGNYTENDIKEGARAFTGYRLDRKDLSVEHFKRQWDEGTKTVFGKTGPFDGEQVIDLIFTQPAAARLVPSKLWEYFVAEDPSTRLVDSLAESFGNAHFNTGPLLKEIFVSKAFYSEAVVRNQIKPPVQFLVQMLKQLEIPEPPKGFPLQGQQELGQQLFAPPNVAGWDWGKAWINTNTLLTRYNLAGYLTKGAEESEKTDVAANDAEMMMSGEEMAPKPVAMEKKKPRANRGWKGPDYKKITPPALRENPAELVDALIFRFFQGPLPEKARGSFVEYATAKQGVIFTDKEVAELAHLMLSTPYYQLS